MIIKTNLAIAICLLATACSTSQSGGGANALNVSTGKSFEYDMHSTMNISQSMGGQEMNVATTSDGSVVLGVTDRQEDRIAWTLDMRDIRLSSDNPMTPIRDTSITLPTQRFITTPLGRVLDLQTESDESTRTTQMLVGLNGSEQLSMWFSPLLGSNRRAGESWEENTSDTLQLGEMGMEMRRTAKRLYTFDRVVDTLGVKAARIHVTSPGMTIEGELSVQGMELAIDGDGAVVGTSYYGVNDGVLVSSNQEVQMNMRISVPGQGVMPVTQQTKATYTRKK